MVVVLQCAFTRNFARAHCTGGKLVKLDELDGFEEYFAFVLMESLWRWNLLDQRMHWTTAGGASDDLLRSQSDNKKVRLDY